MASTYYSGIASHFTAEEQQRLIDELSQDGTLEGIDVNALRQKIENSDMHSADVEDYVFLYTYLTGSLDSTLWDPEIVSPDQVGHIEEWANLSTSSDLTSDIEAFLNLLGPDENLFSVDLRSSFGSAGSNYTVALDEIVNYANDWYATSSASSDFKSQDYTSLINLAFSIGSPALAIVFILRGMPGGEQKIGDETYDIKETMGMAEAVSDAQQAVTDKMQESIEYVEELQDDLLALDMEDPNTSSDATVIRNNIEMTQTINSSLVQSLTTLTGIMTDLSEAGRTLNEMERAGKRWT